MISLDLIHTVFPPAHFFFLIQLDLGSARGVSSGHREVGHAVPSVGDYNA